MWVQFVVGFDFLRVLRFSPLLKNQHLQISIQPGNRTSLKTTSVCGASWVNIEICLLYYLTEGTTGHGRVRRHHRSQARFLL